MAVVFISRKSSKIKLSLNFIAAIQRARLESLAGQFWPRALCFTPLVYSMTYEGHTDNARLKFLISTPSTHRKTPFQHVLV